MGERPKEGSLKTILGEGRRKEKEKDKEKGKRKSKTATSEKEPSASIDERILGMFGRGKSGSEGETSLKKKKASLKPDVSDSISASEMNVVQARYVESVLSVRSVAHPTNYFETMIHVLKGNIGAGLLAMGDVCKNSGLLLGPLGLVLIGILCTYCIHLLLICARKCSIKWKLPIDPTFPETIELSFKLGPKMFRSISTFSRWCVIIALIVTQLGFCSVYYLLVGEAVKRYFDLVDVTFDLIICLCIIYPVILGITLIRNLKYLAPLSLVANLLIVLAMTLVLVVVCQDIPPLSERPLIAPFERWPFAFGTILFAYEGINLVIPLRNEMKKPSSFQSTWGVLNVSMTIIISLYTMIGFLTYLKYGDDIQGNVTSSLPKGHWITIVADVSVALAITFTYPLQFYVALKMILEILIQKFEERFEGWKAAMILEYILRVSLVTLTFILAVCVPHLSLFISLVGALCSTWLAIIFPVLSHVSLYSPWSNNHKPENIHNPSYITKIWIGFFFHIFVLIFGFFGVLTGTFVTIYDLVKKFQE